MKKIICIGFLSATLFSANVLPVFAMQVEHKRAEHSRRQSGGLCKRVTALFVAWLLLFQGGGVAAQQASQSPQSMSVSAQGAINLAQECSSQRYVTLRDAAHLYLDFIEDHNPLLHESILGALNITVPNDSRLYWEAVDIFERGKKPNQVSPEFKKFADSLCEAIQKSKK